ncbi:MAG: UDP-N-acetylmuramoyl-L-alanine--D-glutamate ligase [Acidimicrobiia bacterium]|nr:MAG: UDP-N-acetylmuramoyl-L-alanine--D-glutamate ligase [Acidimicrobiia bacterium]
MRTLILGTNLRGLADAARISLADGAEVVMYDAESPQPPSDLSDRVTVLPAEWQTGFLDGVDRVVTSPWFAEVQPPLSDVLSAGIEVITEAGFGLEHIDLPFVAVTGTNGKTTVTELIAEMLTASCVQATGGGNLGTPVSGMTDTDAQILVLELSSYQLRFLGSAVPMAAALLNIAPDHLDWHGTFEAYVAAKTRIFSGMDSTAVLAYNADDPVVVDAVAGAECSLVPCSGLRIPQGGNGVAQARIVIEDNHFFAPTADPSFLFDIVTAGTVALAAGATPEGVAASIGSFRPGAHRRQIVETNDGIVWIDDSKATNPHATTAAVAAYAPVVLLAGGQNKGLDLSPIASLDGVTKLIAFGEAGPAIGEITRQPVTVVDSLEEAVEAARATAGSGDTVLLSPGCASFDEFSSYAERGDVFQALVKRTEGTAAWSR